jgi:hypothetical protein
MITATRSDTHAFLVDRLSRLSEIDRSWMDSWPAGRTTGPSRTSSPVPQPCARAACLSRTRPSIVAGRTRRAGRSAVSTTHAERWAEPVYLDACSARLDLGPRCGDFITAARGDRARRRGDPRMQPDRRLGQVVRSERRSTKQFRDEFCPLFVRKRIEFGQQLLRGLRHGFRFALDVVGVKCL